jgi:hypothetical protein
MPLTSAVLNTALRYPDFRALVGQLAQERRTSGPEQLPLLVRSTAQNQALLDQAYQFPLLPELVETLRQLTHPWRWAVLAEAWCGDTAHHLPVLAHLAEASNGCIDLRVFLRSEHPDLMAEYQTNGKNSIPKLICLDAATLTELGTWGPRPAAAEALSHRLHAEPDLPITQLIKQMNAWADENKGQALQQELLACVATWQTKNI